MIGGYEVAYDSSDEPLPAFFFYPGQLDDTQLFMNNPSPAKSSKTFKLNYQNFTVVAYDDQFKK